MKKVEIWLLALAAVVISGTACADSVVDGINNLLEYALGGNPNAVDSFAVLPDSGLVFDEGTNWLEYVYRRHRDAAARGLIYEVRRTGNLEFGSWIQSGITEVSAAIGADFESVTNRISTETEDMQFMKLIVEL